MIVDLGDEVIVRLQRFSDRHCDGKEPDLELLIDMARALNLRIGVELVEEGGNK